MECTSKRNFFGKEIIEKHGYGGKDFCRYKVAQELVKDQHGKSTENNGKEGKKYNQHQGFVGFYGKPENKTFVKIKTQA
jgi:hypothetical protein